MIDQLIDYQEGTLDETETIELFQGLIDSGMAWRLEGHIGRQAMGMIEDGYCVLGEEGHRDYYGNYVPSRTEVEPGSKGSPEYVAARSEGRDDE
jgi:hypothetical protein